MPIICYETRCVSSHDSNGFFKRERVFKNPLQIMQYLTVQTLSLSLYRSDKASKLRLKDKQKKRDRRERTPKSETAPIPSIPFQYHTPNQPAAPRFYPVWGGEEMKTFGCPSSEPRQLPPPQAKQKSWSLFPAWKRENRFYHTRSRPYGMAVCFEGRTHTNTPIYTISRAARDEARLWSRRRHFCDDHFLPPLCDRCRVDNNAFC